MLLRILLQLEQNNHLDCMPSPQRVSLKARPPPRAQWHCENRELQPQGVTAKNLGMKVNAGLHEGTTDTFAEVT